MKLGYMARNRLNLKHCNTITKGTVLLKDNFADTKKIKWGCSKKTQHKNFKDYNEKNIQITGN